MSRNSAYHGDRSHGGPTVDAPARVGDRGQGRTGPVSPTRRGGHACRPGRGWPGVRRGRRLLEMTSGPALHWRLCRLLPGLPVTVPREFSLPVRVYYEDTDAGGVVYHANYLKYLERARTEVLRCLGLEQTRLRREFGILFAVRSLNIEYHRPAVLDDALEVRSQILHRRHASLDFQQSLHRADVPGVLAGARVRVACLSADGLRPCPLPPSLMSLLADVC